MQIQTSFILKINFQYITKTYLRTMEIGDSISLADAMITLRREQTDANWTVHRHYRVVHPAGWRARIEVVTASDGATKTYLRAHTPDDAVTHEAVFSWSAAVTRLQYGTASA